MCSRRVFVSLAVAALAICWMSDSAYAATRSARAFSFGSNGSGRGSGNGRTGLGLATGITPIATPIISTNLAGKSPSQVGAGQLHSILLTDDGSVFSFGGNLGGVTGLGAESGTTLVATPINTDNLAGQTTNQIAGGLFHNLLLASDGTVLSFGSNNWGKTGLGIDAGGTLIATPIDNTNFGSKTISQIAAGYTHSLLLSDDGSVYSFGENLYGPTGLGTTGGSTLVATPIITTNLSGKKITQVAAGYIHSLLLADDGSVFSFGQNFYGKTGLGTDIGSTLVATPIDMTNLQGKSILQVAGGDDFSLLLADDGTVYSFGSNSFGATGRGTTIGDTLVATQIDMSNLAGKKITKVAAGTAHSLLLADDGTVYSFGSNSFGATGLGTTVGNALIATPIDTTNLAGLRVIDISAGAEHSLLIAVPEPLAFALGATALAILSVLRRQRIKDE